MRRSVDHAPHASQKNARDATAKAETNGSAKRSPATAKTSIVPRVPSKSRAQHAASPAPASLPNRKAAAAAPLRTLL